MKVGGNESATKFFQQNGGSAALNSKDPKTKYTSSAATKYKEELKRRAARDAQEYVGQPSSRLERESTRMYTDHRRRHPGEVVITDGEVAGSDTPAGEPDDDFFSSWDKPAIKKPTPPISRTATPPVIGRTSSPFPNNNGANGKDIARTASPLAKTEAPAPTASRITSSAALRKTSGAPGPRKANVLGAKKVPKLGAKKLTADVIDFDEAEKKAKEEAERIAKLGYDPDEEADAKKAAATKAEGSGGAIVSPTPVSPARGGYGSHSREKSASEIERLGMGVARLGFGQVGGSKAAAAPKKNSGGFGSVGPVKATAAGEFPLFLLFRQKTPVFSSPLQIIIQQLTTLRTRRRREVRAVQVRRAEGHLVGRVLRQGRLRPQRAVRGQAAAAGVRGRQRHLVQRLLRPPRGGRCGGGLRRPRERRQGLHPQVRHHGGRRPREPHPPARRGRGEAAGRHPELSRLKRAERSSRVGVWMVDGLKGWA